MYPILLYEGADCIQSDALLGQHMGRDVWDHEAGLNA